jgi:hypothetical protein
MPALALKGAWHEANLDDSHSADGGDLRSNSGKDRR